MNTQTFGDCIKEARTDLGLSLKQVARAAKVDDSWLSKVERGLVNVPDPASIDRVAEVLELNTADLFAVIGYSGRGLPVFAPYLRAKYDLPEGAVAQLEAEFARINEQYQHDQGQRS